MKLRCPYCRQDFEGPRPGKRGAVRACPACGKSLLMPGFYPRRPIREEKPAGWTPKGPARSFLFRRPLRLVAAIIGLVVVGALLLQQAYEGPPVTEHHNLEVARLNMETLRAALDILHRHCGRYPSAREGLVSLIHDPGMDGWQGPYIFELKPDPWGHAFGYTTRQETVILDSRGPDREPGSSDDLLLSFTHDAPPPPSPGLFPADIRPPRQKDVPD